MPTRAAAKRALESPEASRPSKRARTDASTSPFAPLPPAALALALPAHLARPPTHAQHAPGLFLSRAALRKLTTTPGLSAEDQSRAYLQLAELGLQALALETTAAPDDADADGTTTAEEVDHALGKAIACAPKHARALRTHAALLQAESAAARGQAKFAHKTLARAAAALTSADPPALGYAVQLAKVQLHLSAPPPKAAEDNFDAPPRTPGRERDPAVTELTAALDAVRALRAAADAGGPGHERVALLACVLRAGIAVTRGLWERADAEVADAEAALGLAYPVSTPAADVLRRTSTGSANTDPLRRTSTGASASAKGKQKERDDYINFNDPFEATCAAHVLVYAVVARTHAGDAEGAAVRLSHLHAILDTAGMLSAYPTGVAEIELPTGPPLRVRVTPPRVLFALGYLVSASAKRDPVGRKAKRATFSRAGLEALANQTGPAFEFSVEDTVRDVEDAAGAVDRIKADLLSELAAVSIHRNEFADADKTLDELIAHTRARGLWDVYAPRVTLHHAHLAHARLDHARALMCYDAAAFLGARAGAEAQGEFVALAARAGAVLLRIGLFGENSPTPGATTPAPAVAGEARSAAPESEAAAPAPVEEEEMPPAKAKAAAKGRPKGKRKAKAKGKAKGKGKAKAAEEEEEPVVHADDAAAAATDSPPGEGWTYAQLVDEAESVARACEGQDGQLAMAAAVLRVVVSPEILRSKSCLCDALTLATAAGANHTRALLLALGAAHYARTDPPYAVDTLRGADVLAAGLGALPKPPRPADGGGGGDTSMALDPNMSLDVGASVSVDVGASAAPAQQSLGSVALRLWCGERKLELFRRSGPGEAARAERQEGRNVVFRAAVDEMRAQVQPQGLWR